MSIEGNVSLLEGVSLRPVRGDDHAFLFEVYASSRAEELAQVPWNQEEKQSFLKSQFEAQKNHYNKHFSDADFNIVLVQGNCAGRLYLGRWEEEIRIIDIALLPDFRGKGIGGLLLGEILEEARQANKCVRIHVEKQNRAKNLYSRLGFQVLSDNGVYEFMEWDPERGGD